LLGKFIDFLLSRLSEPFKDRIRYSKLNLFWNIYLNFRLIHSKTIFYGQNSEDSILVKYLPEGNGRYLDVGSGWPVRGSNSYYFYKRGWNGLTIDPIDQNILLQKIFRPRDHQIRALIGIAHGEADFYRFEPYEYSTSNVQVAKDIIQLKQARLVNVERYSIMRLDSLNLKALPSEPTLLSIDVEGKDFDVLLSINWNEYLPRVICIETWSNHSEYKIEINSLLKERGYLLKEEISLSNIYVHNSYLKSISEI
jgi:hypothetical protein